MPPVGDELYWELRSCGQNLHRIQHRFFFLGTFWAFKRNSY